MTDKAVQSINLNVCKKLDKRVTKVIATASHVVMYTLEDGHTWVSAPHAPCLICLALPPPDGSAHRCVLAGAQRLMDVEGSLFIVRRCGHRPVSRPVRGQSGCGAG